MATGGEGVGQELLAGFARENEKAFRAYAAENLHRAIAEHPRDPISHVLGIITSNEEARVDPENKWFRRLFNLFAVALFEGERAFQTESPNTFEELSARLQLHCNMSPQMKSSLVALHQKFDKRKNAQLQLRGRARDEVVELALLAAQNRLRTEVNVPTEVSDICALYARCIGHLKH